MYKRVAAVLFPIFAIAFVAVAAWGYQEHQDKNSILIKAENQYQRAFHDLNNHIVKLQEELGKALAVNSSKQMGNSMTNVWRLAYSAQEDIGSLPVSLMSFDKVQEFVSNIGQFSYQMGVRDLKKEPLTNRDRQTMKTLYHHASQIRNDLSNLQAKVIHDNLRWMDVEEALASEEKKEDNVIVDGFKKVNRAVEQYPEVDWGPAMNNMHERMHKKYNQLKGAKVSAVDVKQKLARLLHLSTTKGIRVTKSQKGDYPVYSTYLKKGDKEINAEWTVTGGHLAWMMVERPYQKSKVDYSQALSRATRAAKDLGYGTMSPISYDVTPHHFSFQLVGRMGQIWVYPQIINIKISRDRGDIVGIQADECLFNPVGNIPKPKLTEVQARQKVNPQLRITKTNLAYIYDQAGNGVLCYEFLGTLDKQTYRVFINAKNGEEEIVEQVEKGERAL
jgi:spore germination protein